MIKAGVVLVFLLIFIFLWDKPKVVDTNNVFGGVTKEVMSPRDGVEKEIEYYDKENIKRKAVAYINTRMEGVAYFTEDGVIERKEYCYPGQDLIDRSIINYNEKAEREIIIVLLTEKAATNYNISKVSYRKDVNNKITDQKRYDLNGIEIDFSPQYIKKNRAKLIELNQLLKKIYIKNYKDFD